MCNIDNVRDDLCKRQYIAHAVYLGDEYDVVCNIETDGTTFVCPVNDDGKVNGVGKSFIGTGRPTARMIRDVLCIDSWEHADLTIAQIA